MAYCLTKRDLRLDLEVAFQKAAKEKWTKSYVLRFQKERRKNLDALCDTLWNRTYMPGVSTCFIVEFPKKREVFAAEFIDRIIHHLYYNYLSGLFERTFIADTYSCIPGRETHYGIRRLDHHIRSESKNYQRIVYGMNLDIRGYFMHIDRARLMYITLRTIDRMATHKIHSKGRQQWRDILDVDFLKWLSEVIIMHNPKNNCRLAGSRKNWIGLDPAKSLFYTEEGLGLPIGNLTSQLLSNVYLNELDQFMKRILHCKHYGRYVDDAFVISHDRKRLLAMIPLIREFLKDHLGLELHMGKLQVVNTNYGIEFLGSFVKPYRIYVANKSLERTCQHIREINYNDSDAAFRSINSYVGMMVHTASYNIRANLFLTPEVLALGSFDRDLTKFTLSPLLQRPTQPMEKMTA